MQHVGVEEQIERQTEDPRSVLERAEEALDRHEQCLCIVCGAGPAFHGAPRGCTVYADHFYKTLALPALLRELVDALKRCGR